MRYPSENGEHDGCKDVEEMDETEQVHGVDQCSLHTLRAMAPDPHQYATVALSPRKNESRKKERYVARVSVTATRSISPRRHRRVSRLEPARASRNAPRTAAGRTPPVDAVAAVGRRRGPRAGGASPGTRRVASVDRRCGSTRGDRPHGLFG